jgi:hypothetical protein
MKMVKSAYIYLPMLKAGRSATHKLVFVLMLTIQVTQLNAQGVVSSISGALSFDVENDGTHEMLLNSIGLGVGMTPSSNLSVSGNAIFSSSLSIGEFGSSNLNISGTLSLSSESLNGEATLSDHSVYLVDSSSDNVVLVLPYASNVSGRVITVKKTSTLNQIYLSGGGNLIDDEVAIKLSSGNMGAFKLVSNGHQWNVLSSYPSAEPISQTATDIFNETFSGSGNLHESNEPLTGTPWVTISSTLPGWQADGTNTDSDNGFIYLPFNVQSGHFYCLSMDVVEAGVSTGWVGLGFARDYSGGTPRNNLADLGPWLMVREDRSQIHQTYEGFGTDGESVSFQTSNTGIINLKLKLDTRLNTWYATWLVDDVVVRGPSPHTLSDNLTHVGFGKVPSASAGNVDNFRLQQLH